MSSDAQKTFSRRFKVFQVFMVALCMAFLFLLPVWSRLFNDSLGFFAELCHTPAEKVECGSGESYLEIAKRLNRVNANGSFIGCSCEQGIFGDWACASGQGSFSVSYYISTAPGTGAMAAFTAWPILAQWLYGVGNAGVFLRKCSQETSASSIAYQTLKYTQILFQVFYGLFLINTLCVNPHGHATVVVLFIIAEIVHFVTLAIVMGYKTRSGKFILAITSLGTFSVLFGFFFPKGPSWFGQHAFWLGECIGLSCMFLLAPVLSITH